MKSYHFDVGDSNAGPIGYCARVRARSKREALALLRQFLCDSELVSNEFNEDRTGIEYLEVYFNADAIAAKDIDEWEYEENDD